MSESIQIDLDSLTCEQATALAEALDGDSDHDETVQALARKFGDSVLMANDGNQAIECTSETASEAAQEYVDGGDWNDASGFVDVGVWRRWTLGNVVFDGEQEWHVIALPTVEPPCSADGGHGWRSRHAVVGGLEGNPGVQGNGGGVIIAEVCDHCGCLRSTNTWAQHGGTQGLTSVRYEETGHGYYEAWQQWYRSTHGDSIGREDQDR